jgi:hypothetical protein
MEEHVHEFTALGEIAAPQVCKGCGQQLTPVTIYLHPDEKVALDWLVQDRKKGATAIINHFITLEYGKRRRAAAQRVRKPKA